MSAFLNHLPLTAAQIAENLASIKRLITLKI